MACAIAAGCLPDTSDFTIADAGAETDAAEFDLGADAAVDGGQDMFVPQSCTSEDDCRSPRNGCQNSPGSCESGECVYESRTGEGCDDGDPCTTGDVCEATGCVGASVTCAPPAPRCDGGELVTSSGGRCEAGECSYDESREPCSLGCSAGACEVDVCVPAPWSLTDITAAAAVGFNADADHRTDDGGNDHIVYVSDGGLRYLFRPRGGSWVDEQVEGAGPGTLPSDPQLGFDAAGAPHIVFSRWNDEVVHAVKPGGAWVADRVADGSVPGVTGTPDGAIHIVFENFGLRHAVLASGATDWDITAIRRTDGGFTRAANADTLRLLSDGSGQLHLVFTDFGEDELSYGRFTTEWTLETVHPALVLPSAFDATIDTAGGVHVSFSDDAGRDLRYSHRPPGAGVWSPTVVHAAVERMGDPSAIAVTPSGAIHIVYRDEDRREVRYATRPAGGSFSHDALEPDNGFAAGAYADDAGRVRLVYRAVPPVGADVLRVAEVRECP